MFSQLGFYLLKYYLADMPNSSIESVQSLNFCEGSLKKGKNLEGTNAKCTLTGFSLVRLRMSLPNPPILHNESTSSFSSRVRDSSAFKCCSTERKSFDIKFSLLENLNVHEERLEGLIYSMSTSITVLININALSLNS